MRQRIFVTLFAFVCLAGVCIAQPASSAAPLILRMSPTSGPEGSRIAITGDHLQNVTAALFGTTPAQFRMMSSQKLIVIVPHKSAASVLSVISPNGRASAPFAFTAVDDPRIPQEVSYKAGYVNPVSRPEAFTSARLWGIAIADARFPQFQSARVEVAWTQLSCRANGQEVVLNDDTGRLSGGLYVRDPWFGGHDYHEIMPLKFDLPNRAVILRVGERTDRV